MWQRIVTAPFDRDLEVAVLEGEETHRLIFPCRREPSGWVNANTRERVVVDPTHWRRWGERD